MAAVTLACATKNLAIHANFLLSKAKPFAAPTVKFALVATAPTSKAANRAIQTKYPAHATA